MSYEMDPYRLAEVLDEYEGYQHDIKLGAVYGTALLGEFVWLLKHTTKLEAEECVDPTSVIETLEARNAELEEQREQWLRESDLTDALHDECAERDARIAELEAYIVRNCDPFDMTVEDADFFATINPYALEKGDE